MIKWIKRHKIFVALMAAALLLCTIISISYMAGGTMWIGDKVQGSYTTVSQKATGASDGLKNGIKGVLGYKSLLNENEELKTRVSELEKEVRRQGLKSEELVELRELYGVLNYKEINSNYEVVSGNIIALDNSNYYKIFTIDRGTESGVYKNAIVINEDGLIGRVMETGDGYSKVISLIDENVKISFQTVRDGTIMGIVQGSGDGKLTGYTFDSEAGIVDGDILITTGIGVFPQNIQIGKVMATSYNENTQLKTIEVKPTVSFKALKRVTVLI